MQLIAAVDSRPQVSVERITRQCDRVTQPGREAAAVGGRLSQAIGVELPDSGAGLQFGARIVSRRASLTILLLTGIRRRADVHVEGTAL